MKGLVYTGVAVVVGSHIYLLVTDKSMSKEERQMHSILNIVASGLILLNI
jgi:hypothetical protein